MRYIKPDSPLGRAIKAMIPLGVCYYNDLLYVELPKPLFFCARIRAGRNTWNLPEWDGW